MRFDPFTLLVWLLFFLIPWALFFGCVWIVVKAVQAVWP